MNYDQLPDVIASGFNWETMTVYALLYEGVTFDPLHQRASEVGQWIKREKLQGKYTTDEGDLCGQPAVFYMVIPYKEYQMVLGWDDGRNDDVVLGFFDTNTDGYPIQVERRGLLFVRPSMEEPNEAATYSIWLRPGQA